MGLGADNCEDLTGKRVSVLTATAQVINLRENGNPSDKQGALDCVAHLVFNLSRKTEGDKIALFRFYPLASDCGMQYHANFSNRYVDFAGICRLDFRD